MKSKIKKGPAAHLCHAEGCDTEVPEAMFMCAKHWRRLPRSLKRAIWAHYENGQEIRKDPSEAYLLAAEDAIEWLAKAEGFGND